MSWMKFECKKMNVLYLVRDIDEFNEFVNTLDLGNDIEFKGFADEDLIKFHSENLIQLKKPKPSSWQNQNKDKENDVQWKFLTKGEKDVIEELTPGNTKESDDGTSIFTEPDPTS